jgi:hypothetical protein
MKAALIAFALFTGYYSALMFSRVDSAIPGYGVSTNANGGDPLAVIVWIVVSWCLIRLVKMITR